MERKDILEGKISSAAARILALAIKRKVIILGRELRETEKLEDKLDLLSKQVSALSALTLAGISVSGNGLLSKGGIISGLFTEEEENISPKI